MPRRFVLLPLLVLPLAAAAGEPAALSATQAYEIRIHVPNADLSDLRPDQVRRLAAVLHHGDGFDAAYLIRSILLSPPPQD